MLNAGIINCWNETQYSKIYTVAVTLNFLPIPACLVKMKHERKEYGSIIKPSARCVKKSGLEEVTKSRVLNQALLQSKEFHFSKCSRIKLNHNPSNISSKLMEFSKEPRSSRI